MRKIQEKVSQIAWDLNIGIPEVHLVPLPSTLLPITLVNKRYLSLTPFALTGLDSDEFNYGLVAAIAKGMDSYWEGLELLADWFAILVAVAFVNVAQDYLRINGWWALLLLASPFALLRAWTRQWLAELSLLHADQIALSYTRDLGSAQTYYAKSRPMGRKGIFGRWNDKKRLLRAAAKAGLRAADRAE